MEIDNNFTGQEIKPFVIARKNFLFCTSVEGAELSDPLIFTNDKNSLSFANTDQNSSYNPGGSNPNLRNICSTDLDKSQILAEEKNEGISEGAEALCLTFVIIRTAKLHSLDPYHYYVMLLKNIPLCNSVDDYETAALEYWLRLYP